jgi:hypothetical protein
MDVGQLVGSVSWTTVLAILVGGYALAVPRCSFEDRLCGFDAVLDRFSQHEHSQRSINYERNLVVYDPGVTRELEADFTADLAHCVECSAPEDEGRRRSARFVDSTRRLCSPLL